MLPYNTAELLERVPRNGFEFDDIEGVRNKFKDSPYFDACHRFCEKYDSPAFDPDYETLPLEHFTPMVLRIFSRKPYEAAGSLQDSLLNEAKHSLGQAYPSPEEN